MIIYYLTDTESSPIRDIECVSPVDTYRCPIKPFGDLCAEDYLELAINDLSDDNPMSAVNAFSNAKRSFHYQVDRILFTLGLWEKTRKKSFPQKIAILEAVQIIPGALLRTFNRERNLMEHEYTQPTIEQAENAICLCELLLLATREILTAFPVLLRARYRQVKKDYLYQLLPDDSYVKVREIIGVTRMVNESGECSFEGIFKLFSENKDRELKDGITLKPVDELEMDLKTASKDDCIKMATLFSVPVTSKSVGKYLSSIGTVNISTDIEFPNWKNTLSDLFDNVHL